MNNKLYVKFTPFTEYTYANLINKTVRFSTVYDFNDFNEESVFVSARYDEYEDIENYIWDYIKENGLNLMRSLIDHAGHRNHVSHLKYLREVLVKKLIEGNVGYLRSNLHVIIEVISYLETGILCLSHIDVFKDESAQLMFAHYADNLQGLALVYEAVGDEKIRKVEYENVEMKDSRDEYGLLKLMRGKEFGSFLYKSPKWSYEQEHRVFRKPGIYKAEGSGLDLKGIFYTKRYAPNWVESLQRINENFYDGQLFIEGIDRNYSKDKRFTLIGKPMETWVEEYLDGIKKTHLN